ncbi:MAG: tol-pal system protein YbgF [Desulfobacula sp.]|uniref:tol-pal system protein YbgF n=1 Tax=Desulfobacula sp. TaxID=2593537 RepID=UPI0025C27A08|nr:tol-pal system protein YbgF [Desulfobacula sp.]MCD4721787.1 tol-pal system protein YbgF [Desulfobacula sp.]
MGIKNFFYIVIVLLFLSGCVEPQKFVTLENRVAAIEMENNRQLLRQKEKTKATVIQNEQNQLKLRQDLGTIEKKINESHSISQEEYAELKYNIQTIKEDFQRVEGLIEEINHSFEEYHQKDREIIEKKLERLDHAISKNYEKLIKLEKYMGFEPSALGGIDGIEKKVVLSEDPGKNAEQELYNFAKKLFDDGDMENARIQFENFINKYPDSENTDNARFWIADSYYAEKWFEKAILEYQKVLEDYPDSNKLAAARLKQGYAFAELGEKANARLILRELLKKHPESNEAKYAQKKLESLK